MLESNQRPPGHVAERHYQQQLPRVSKRDRARGEGFEPSPSGSKPGGLPLADPRITSEQASISLQLRQAKQRGAGTRGVLSYAARDSLRDDKKRSAGVEPACPSWKAGASCRSAKSALHVAHHRESYGGRNRTCELTLNRRPPDTNTGNPAMNVRRQPWNARLQPGTFGCQAGAWRSKTTMRYASRRHRSDVRSSSKRCWCGTSSLVPSAARVSTSPPATRITLRVAS